MPYQKVMEKFGRGKLRSGGKSGPVVKSREQAVAIMLSEKRKGTHASLDGLRRHLNKSR